MKLSRTSLRFPLGILSGFALLIGCQLGSDPTPTSSTAMTAKGTAEYSGSSRLPDSGVWRTNNVSRSDSGKGKVVCAAPKPNGRTECSQSFDLKNVLGSDLLLQDVYMLGVHFATLSYSQTGNLPQLNHLSNSTVLRPLEAKLVLEFNELFKKTATADQKPTSADLVAYYAGLLLDGAASVKDSGLPKGMVADSVKKALVQVAAKKSIPAKDLAAKSLLGLTSESIRTITNALVKADVKFDTTGLYPAVPVRESETVKIASDVTEGEAAVAVSGAFTWEPKARIRKAEIKVVTAEGAVDDSVRVSNDKLFDPTTGSWVLTNSMTIKAKMGAKIGTDTLIVTIIGDSGSVTSKTPFKVLRGDTVLPKLSITEPAPGTEVPNATDKIKVVVDATDAKGVAEVKIGNTNLTSAPYSAEIDLAVGYNIIAVQAKDNSGNVSRDTVIVLRAKSTTNTDVIEPVVSLRSPSQDTSVVTGLPSLDLSWNATDNVGVKKVTLNDAEITGTAGAYSKSVALHDGPNVFEIKAFDDAGNVGKKSVTITRPADQSKPGITPPSDQTVASDVTTFKLTWKITNSQKAAKIALNGTEVTLGAEVSSEVSLKPGANTFNLVVTDLSGATISETVVITRTVDVVLLSITALTDRSVGADIDTATLVWAITNADQAKSGTVNSDPITVGASITKQVKLDPGPNVFKLTLKDAAGTTVSSSVTITRAIDTDLLGVVKLSDRSVNPETETDTLTWAIINSAKAVSATLNDKPVTVGATIREIVSLVAGDNTFILTLKDAKGNTVADTVVVARAADATGPSVVWVAPTKKTEVEATVTTFAAQVKVTDASGVESVTLNGVVTKKETGDLYAISLALPKPDGNPIWIVVVAKDAKGNTTKDSLSVTRKAPDGTNKPIIKLVKPALATGNALPFETAKLHVEAEVTDALLAIDPTSVTIGGIAATATGSVYAADVPVLATGKPTTITIKAANANGIAATLDIEVTRAKDAVAPVVKITSPSKDTTVPNGTATLSVTATASDVGSGLQSLSINGGKNLGATGTVSVDLKLGKNVIQAIATDSAGNSDTASLTATVQDIAGAPTFSIKAGNYDEIQSVTLTSATTGAVIYYTTDGTAPTDKSTKYAGAITVGKSQTIKAIAVAAGYTNSTVSSAAYVITLQVEAPVFKPAGGTYTSMQSVTITCATTGAVIYYTTDGTVPTDKSTKYPGAFDVGSSKTIKAIAVLSGYTNSAVASAAYVIDYPAAVAPTFSKLAGTYDKDQSVAISTTTPSATIHYTTDGKDPTTTSPKYSTPIAVGKGTTTIKAFVVAGGYDNSTISSAIYVVDYAAASAPTFTPPASKYPSAQSVKLSSATSGATIHFTTDGTTPTTSSPKYAGVAIAVSDDMTIKAIAVANGFDNSAVASAAYVIEYPAGTPEIDVSGTASSKKVTITSATSGATIYYTVDGTVPTTNSKLLVGASFTLSVAGTYTVKAIAVKSGFSNSTVGTSTQFIVSVPSADLTSILVDGKAVTLNGLTASYTLGLFKTSASIVATAIDGNATISIDGGPEKSNPNTSIVNLTSTKDVRILVKNGSATPKTYSITLVVPTEGFFTDSRFNSDGVPQDYAVGKIGNSWWMLQDLNWSYTSPVIYAGVCDEGVDCKAQGRSYTWAEAKRSTTCPTGWRLPSLNEWKSVFDSAEYLMKRGGFSNLFWTNDAEPDLETIEDAMAYRLAGYKSGQTAMLADENTYLHIRCIR